MTAGVLPDQRAGYREEDAAAAGEAHSLGEVLLVDRPGVSASSVSWTDGDGTRYRLMRGTQDDGVMPRGFFNMAVQHVGMDEVDFNVGPRNCYADGPNADSAEAIYGARFGAELSSRLAGVLRSRIREIIADRSIDVGRRRQLAHWLLSHDGTNGGRKDTR